MGRELPTLRNQPNQVALEVLYTKAGSWGGTRRIQRPLCSCTEERCYSQGGQTLKENTERWWRLYPWRYSKPIWTQSQGTRSSQCHFEQ